MLNTRGAGAGRRRTAHVVAFGVVASLALAVGLSAASASPHAKKDVVTLRLMQNATYQPAMALLIQNFNRVYPDIKIDVQYVPGGNIPSLLLPQLQTGNAPDMFSLEGGATNVNGVFPIAKAGRVVDLSDRPWVKRIPKFQLKYEGYRGKTYMWPGVLNVYGILYNVDLMKQLKGAIPKTFSGIPALCSKINTAGKTPFVEGGFATIGTQLFIRPILGSFVDAIDPLWSSKRTKNQVTFASSRVWTRTLQVITDMKNANCFQSGITGTSRAQGYALFATGQAVMMMGGSQEIAQIKAINPNLNIALAAFPADKAANTHIYIQAGSGTAINTATTHPKEARTFVDFIARAKQSALFAKLATGVSPFDAKLGNLPSFMSSVVRLVKANKVGKPFDSGWPLGVFGAPDGLNNGAVGLFTGQMDAAALLANLDKLWGAAPPN